MSGDRGGAGSDAELGLPGIFELAAGYQRAQVLFAANELDIFRILADGPRSAEAVAAELGGQTRGIAALLDACVALRLLRRSGEAYENTRTTRLFLLPGRDASFAPVLRFWHRFSYGTWGRLAEGVRNNQPQTASGPQPQDLFEQLLQDDARTRLFFDGLAGLAYWPARKLAEIVDFSKHRHLLDVGGGAGVYSATIARRFPDLRVTLFDLEPVCALARERFATVDADGRLRTVSGDFHNESLPRGADCVLISHVLHDWSPEECIALLGRVHRALEPGGEVLVYDFMPASDGSSVEASLFSLALILDTNRGRVYRSDEYRSWLAETGFDEIRQQEVVGGTSVLSARKRG